MKIIFIALVAIMFCCTKNSGQTSKTVFDKAVVAPSATVNVSCDSCAILDTIMITGSGYTAGKEIAVAAERSEDGWTLWYHATTVDANGNISFEYLYKRPPGHYKVTVNQMLNSKKYTVMGSVQFVTY